MSQSKSQLIMTGVGLPSSLALARVGSDIVKATEDLEGGVTLDALVFAEVGLLGAVNLGELDVLLLESCGGLLVLGGEGLAVTAPGSKDCRKKLLAADGGREASMGSYTQRGRDCWT